MTDNANEAAKTNPPSLADVAGCGFKGGRPSGPFFLFGEAFAEDGGLGWRCLNAESDIWEKEEGWWRNQGTPIRALYIREAFELIGDF